MALDISVLVCTYNRASALAEMLDGLTRQTRLEGVTYEVLVVSDGSTDETDDVARQYARTLPLRLLAVPHRGKSAALNAGCRAATGDLVVFVDDDVVLTETWLSELWAASRRRPDVACFQGRVLNRWDCAVPDWLALEGEFQIKGPIVRCDFGANEVPMHPVTFIGANAAVRRTALQSVGEFRTDLGPGAPPAGLGEDTELSLRLARNNFIGLYVPTATVYHPVPADRATQAYFKKWARSAGHAEARIFESYRTSTQLFGMPRYAIRRYLELRLRQFLFFLSRNHQASFYFKVRSWIVAAVLAEARSWTGRPFQATFR